MTQPEIVAFGEIVAYLGLGSSLTPADAGLVQMLKGMVENQIRAFCGHDVTQPADSYVHYLPEPRVRVAFEPLVDGVALGAEARDETSLLQLPQLFVRVAGLEVREDPAAFGGQTSGAFGDETLLTLGTDYFLDVDDAEVSRSGQLIRHGAAWSTRPRTVKVTFQAGLTATDLDGPFSDVKFAAIDEIALRYGAAKSRQGAGSAIRSESIGGEYAVTYDTSAVPAAAVLSDATRERLSPYVRLSP